MCKLLNERCFGILGTMKIWRKDAEIFPKSVMRNIAMGSFPVRNLPKNSEAYTANLPWNSLEPATFLYRSQDSARGSVSEGRRYRVEYRREQM
ncbi:hypothetical protein AVEN_12711-1 [Araneus ventricosus]|uniref:Uncharacterized protein n=1 Tax=Araneus ventricosus TaxID=182803 RepID=A0A4Y2AB38_ARAVE|nr:hypothetical protein AVEN_12711-1 [Araneus ventricosus]